MLILKKEIKDQSDEKLMKLIIFGDEKAFNELYKRYHRRLHYYFYRMLNHNKETADDFLQEIFFKIVNKPELFNPKRTFSTWIFSIAHNMCKNEYRRLSSKPLIDNEIPDIHSINEEFIASDKQEFMKSLFSELDKMDEINKTAFLLRYRENFGVKEISEILNCAEGTIKSKLHYTSKKLADKLRIFNPTTL